MRRSAALSAVLLVLSAAFMVWMERKVCAYIQDRNGPNRVGYAGVLQPFADVLKLLFKEELRPKASDALLFALAPVISATSLPVRKRIRSALCTPRSAIAPNRASFLRKNHFPSGLQFSGPSCPNWPVT